MSDASRPIGDDDLLALVDGRLDPARAALVEDWLREHPEAAERVAVDRRQRELLRAGLAPLADEPVPARLRLETVAQRLRERRPPRTLLAAGAAGLLAVGTLFGWGASEWRRAAGGAPVVFANEALAAHRTYAVEVAHPVEVGSSQSAHLAKWLGNRLGVPVSIPVLDKVGYRLLGGRLLPGPNGPAGQLMYERAPGDRVTLFLGPGKDRESIEFRAVEGKDMSALYWSEGGVRYAISGPSCRDGLMPIAREVHLQLGLGPR